MSVINNSIVSKFEKNIGLGTSTRAFYPAYMFYEYGYFAFIYSKLELGAGQPVWITGIRFNMVGDAVITKTIANQTLKMGQVNSTEFATNIQNGMIQQPFSGWSASNISIVKSNFVWSVPEDNNGWIEIPLDTPYQYDPTNANSNLLVVWENRHGTYYSGNTTPAARITNGGFRSYYDYQDNSMPLVTDYGTRDSVGRPNIQLVIKV